MLNAEEDRQLRQSTLKMLREVEKLQWRFDSILSQLIMRDREKLNNNLAEYQTNKKSLYFEAIEQLRREVEDESFEQRVEELRKNFYNSRVSPSERAFIERIMNKEIPEPTN